MPAGGAKKIGLQFSAEDLNYEDMVAAFTSYRKWFYT